MNPLLISDYHWMTMPQFNTNNSVYSPTINKLTFCNMQNTNTCSKYQLIKT
ncbi:hypothetical protein HanPSC8_Chr06g0232481 [Helianthus annuus]|nr:hypothetical protein HanPSC8_Chr06g0232481 [Helianthus annuus]